jgi:hypothetical protein
LRNPWLFQPLRIQGFQGVNSPRLRLVDITQESAVTDL